MTGLIEYLLSSYQASTSLAVSVMPWQMTCRERSERRVQKQLSRMRYKKHYMKRVEEAGDNYVDLLGEIEE